MQGALQRAGAAGFYALVVAAFLLGCVAIATSANAAASGRFGGKFELVPLFDRGHVPHLSNGHQEYAERNTWSFTRPNGERITVRAGRVTDGASIPQALWSLGFPPDGSWLQAAGGHDECYKSRGFEPADRTRPSAYDRAACDQLLDEMMTALGTPPWKRALIYQGVRLGGGVGWGR